MALLDESADMLINSDELRAEVTDRRGAVPSLDASPAYRHFHHAIVEISHQTHLPWERSLQAILQHALSRTCVQSSMEPLSEESDRKGVIPMTVLNARATGGSTRKRGERGPARHRARKR